MTKPTTSLDIGAVLAAIEPLFHLPEELAALRVELTAMAANVEKMRKLIPPTLISVKEAAERLDVHTDTVRRRINAGEIRAVKIGGSLRVDFASIITAV